MSTVTQTRERLLASIEGRTVCLLFQDTVSAHGGLDALAWQEAGAWKAITWRQYGERVREAAMGLMSLGVGVGDVVALQATNRPEHVIADLGALHAGAVPVSIYNTLADDQIAYVAGNCEATVAVLEDPSFLARWQSVRDQLPQLAHVVLLHGTADGAITWDDLLAKGREHLAQAGEAAFDERWKAVDPGAPATLIYTSGTTGPPKGVVLTHRNILFLVASSTDVLALPHGTRALSYLPLAHVAERNFSHYLGIKNAGKVFFEPDLNKIAEALPVARPQAFLAVPRVWEKMRAALQAAVAAAEPRKRKLGTKAFEVARQHAAIAFAGRKPSVLLSVQHKLFERVVYSKIRARLGLDDLTVALTGAAPMPDDLLIFFSGIGIEICNVYGMTETTAVTNANLPGRTKLGTVGPALPGVEVAIAPDGEIIARGPNMTPEYLERPEATAELFDADGWLHTGDLGSIDADGYLAITGRKKELIITAGGKNISPSNIETMVKMHPLIGQVCVIGDNRQFIAALVVLDPEAAQAWAKEHGVSGSMAELSQRADVRAEVGKAIDTANAKIARVEQIKQWELLPSDWTVESGELTPSLKLKRHVVHEKYSDVIDGLYPV